MLQFIFYILILIISMVHLEGAGVLETSYWVHCHFLPSQHFNESLFQLQ